METLAAAVVIIVVLVLSLLLISAHLVSMKERSDLLDRLLARDLPELATFQIERDKAKLKEPEKPDPFVRL